MGKILAPSFNKYIVFLEVGVFQKINRKYKNKLYAYKCVCVCVCVCVLVAQLCLTLCDPRDYGLPDSSVHGIFHTGILEWVAIPFSWGSSHTHMLISITTMVVQRKKKRGG